MLASTDRQCSLGKKFASYLYILYLGEIFHSIIFECIIFCIFFVSTADSVNFQKKKKTDLYLKL